MVEFVLSFILYIYVCVCVYYTNIFNIIPFFVPALKDSLLII